MIDAKSSTKSVSHAVIVLTFLLLGADQKFIHMGQGFQ